MQSVPNLAVREQVAKTYKRPTSTTGHLSNLKRTIFLHLFDSITSSLTPSDANIQQQKKLTEMFPFFAIELPVGRSMLHPLGMSPFFGITCGLSVGLSLIHISEPTRPY